MTRGAFPTYPMCYLQDSDTRGGCAAYATTRQGKEVRDCVVQSWWMFWLFLGTSFLQFRYNPPSASLPASSPSFTLLHPLSLPPPVLRPPQPMYPASSPTILSVSHFLVCSSRVPVLDQGSNITPNQSKNITHVSKLCRFFFFLQQPFASPFSPNFPLFASSPSIQ